LLAVLIAHKLGKEVRTFNPLGVAGLLGINLPGRQVEDVKPVLEATRKKSDGENIGEILSSQARASGVILLT